MSDYERLETDAERPPAKAADHRAVWDRLTPLLTADQVVRDRVEVFARSKRISLEALIALNTRVKVDRHGGVELAWGYRHRNGSGEIVSAVKYRPLDASKKRYAEAKSVFVTPLVIGRRDSLDWFVAEGETDAARLYDLVGDVAAILVLPAGAIAFKSNWANAIPRGATVFLAHDADEPGDKGADKAAKVIGGRTIRIRPPDSDWSDWVGDRDEFIAFVKAARGDDDRPFAMPIDEFIANRIDEPPALIGDELETLLPTAGLLILFARGGKGKTTITIDAMLHLVSGIDWLGFPVPRPVNVLFIENEGPRESFRRKFELKRKLWPHDLAGKLHVATVDWGAVTLKNGIHAADLRDYVLEHEIDLVVGDPLDSLGLDGVGSPEDTREFMRRLGETGLFRDVAWWLLAHARKEGASDELDEVSGAWGGRPDSMLMLAKQDGNRARLSFPKIRWSRRGSRNAYILAFDPDDESFSVAHEETDEERDYTAEIDELFADGAWRIVKEIAATKSNGGIGAAVETVKKVLESHPEKYVSRPGGEVGRHANATCWQTTDFRTSPEKSEKSDTPESGAREGFGLRTFPYRKSEVRSPTPTTDLPTSDLKSDESKPGDRTLDEALGDPTFIAELEADGILAEGSQ